MMKWWRKWGFDCVLYKGTRWGEDSDLRPEQ